MLNIKHNLTKNNVKGITAIKMNWNEFNQFTNQYDIIMSADPFFHKCSYENFYSIMIKFLKIGSKMILITASVKEVNEFIKIVE